MKNNFKIPKYEGGGVYIIYDCRTGRAYIGQSQNIYKRLKTHEYAMKKCNHFISDLNISYKYNMVFCDILHKCEDHDLRLILEKMYFCEALCLCVKLYNKSIEMRDGVNGLFVHIAIMIMSYFKVRDNIQNSIKNKFNIYASNFSYKKRLAFDALDGQKMSYDDKKNYCKNMYIDTDDKKQHFF